MKNITVISFKVHHYEVHQVDWTDDEQEEVIS
jgi:hypothetical protein